MALDMAGSFATSEREARSYGPPSARPAARRTETEGLSGWIDVDPVPLLLVGPTGGLVDANPSALRLLEFAAAASLRGRMLAFVDQQAQRAFQQGLASVVSRRAINCRLILRGNDGCWRQVEILSCGPQILEHAYVRFPAEPQAAPDIDPLVKAFGFTNPEGEVLRRLVQGLAPKEIARVLCMSTNTVRAHLRMLYLKMGVRGIPGLIGQTVRLTR